MHFIAPILESNLVWEKLGEIFSVKSKLYCGKCAIVKFQWAPLKWEQTHLMENLYKHSFNNFTRIKWTHHLHVQERNFALWIGSNKSIKVLKETRRPFHRRTIHSPAFFVYGHIDHKISERWLCALKIIPVISIFHTKKSVGRIYLLFICNIQTNYIQKTLCILKVTTMTTTARSKCIHNHSHLLKHSISFSWALCKLLL